MDDVLLAAEQAVVGAVVQSPEMVSVLADLHPGHFEKPAHGTIFAAAQQVAALEGIPDAIGVMERLKAAGELERVGGASYLHTCVEACMTVVSAPYHAKIVIEASARRRIHDLGTRLQQSAVSPMFEDALSNAAETAEMVSTLAASPVVAADALEGLVELADLIATDSSPYDWLIPGLMERQDRVLLVAAEGAGKSVIGRQVATLLSQGRHPFMPERRIPRQRTLIVDLENPPKLIQRHSRSLFQKATAVEEWQPGCWVWSKPGGLDLKRPELAAILERAVEKVRPSLIVLGPLYKAGFVASGEAAERTAAQVTEVLDRIRERHRVAFWLEHHAPMEQQGHRSLRPFGSGLWARWPEFGLALRRDLEDISPKSRIYKLERFRGDRDEREWPDNLRWGSPMTDEFPWVALWDDGPPREWLP